MIPVVLAESKESDVGDCGQGEGMTVEGCVHHLEWRRIGGRRGRDMTEEGWGWGDYHVSYREDWDRKTGFD